MFGMLGCNIKGKGKGKVGEIQVIHMVLVISHLLRSSKRVVEWPACLCWDLPCDDEPIMYDEYMSDYNVDRIVDKFVNYVNMQSASYETNHVIVTMGEDFQYQAAHSWFINLDKLINAAAEHSPQFLTLQQI